MLIRKPDPGERVDPPFFFLAGLCGGKVRGGQSYIKLNSESGHGVDNEDATMVPEFGDDNEEPSPLKFGSTPDSAISARARLVIRYSKLVPESGGRVPTFLGIFRAH